jgi:hypothetical protein
MKSRKQPEKKKDGGITLDHGIIEERSGGSCWSLEQIRATVTGSRYIQILIILTLVGGFLRFFNLGFNPLWLDEAVTLQFAQQTFGEYWHTVATGTDFNPPLYIWLIHAVITFGTSEVVLRVLSALCGTIAIPAIYLMGKEFWDKNVGIIAAALLTFSGMHISYSQEARAYSLFVVVIVLQIWLYWKAINTNTPRSWIVFGLVSALCCWSHFYGFIMTLILVVLTPVMMLEVFRAGISKIRPFLYGILTCFVACIPLIILTASLFLIRTSKPPTFGLQGFDLFFMAFAQFSSYSLIVLGIFIVLFILGMTAVFYAEWKKAVFILAVIALTFIISNYLSYRMPMEARHLILLLPVFYVGIATSYLIFVRFIRNKAVIYAFILVACLVNAPLLANYYTHLSKEDWRGLSGTLSGVTTEGDFVVTVPNYMDIPLKYYYSPSSDGTVLRGASSVKEIHDILQDRGNVSVYIVMTGDIMAVDPTGGVVAALEQSSVLLQQYPGSTGGIYLLKAN